MFSRRERCFAVALIVAAALSRPASAQDSAPAPTNEETARARQLFQAGVTNYDAGHYGDALAQFQEAYRIKPHPTVRVNIANCYDKLGRPVEAIENFEAFLAAPGSDPKQRDEVRSELKELQKRVGQVALSITPERARVLIDDRDERRAPIAESIRLTEGRHRVTVSLEGYETALRVVDIRPQETVQLRIELAGLQALGPPPAIAAEAPPAADGSASAPNESGATDVVSAPPPLPVRAGVPRETKRSSLPDSVWIAGGLTVALAVTTIITGQLALAANREFRDDLTAVRNPQLNEFQRAGAWERGVDAANRANGLAAASDVLLGFAIIGAGLTTYFCVTHRDEEPPRLSGSLGPGGGRLQLLF